MLLFFLSQLGLPLYVTLLFNVIKYLSETMAGREDLFWLKISGNTVHSGGLGLVLWHSPRWFLHIMVDQEADN